MSTYKPLTRRNFQAWLESHHPRTVAGNCIDANKCPIARFILLTTNNTQVEVSLEQLLVWREGKPYSGTEYKMPVWAQKFINIIDDVPAFPPRTITYGAALRALREAVSKTPKAARGCAA
jgi:hypothetical protein